jgi:hypothetical protein
MTIFTKYCFMASCLFFTTTAFTQTTCTAANVTQLNNCFATTVAPDIISLSSSIALGATTLAIPNNTITLYTNGFDITGNTWAPTGTPTMNVSSNASSPVIQVTKNGTNKFSTINSAGSLIIAFASVLGVELLDFKATPTVSGNVLTWATASETNNKGFQIERSNSDDAWTNIGFVAAQGKAASYLFTDKAPFHTAYYRLRQIDFDGKETLSKVIAVENDKAQSVHLKAYPNPVRDILYFETDNVTDLSSGTHDFEIRNILGQQVL